jgi:alkanesulfonate monooxygenase SsuD/methylene tetrahydromethanopterin reductase-like flavin-dependent oxidoreductase (luciferase family)
LRPVPTAPPDLLDDAAVDELREQAVAADRTGWASLLLTDRHDETALNPLLMSVFLAQHTTRLRLGRMGLALPLWNPLRLAEDIAIADHLTGGRLDIGLTRSGSLFDEWFEAMRLAWTEESPRPLQTPHPPLFIMGSGDIEWAARVGATLITTATDPASVRQARDAYDQAAVRHLHTNRRRQGGGVALCRLLAVGSTYEQARRTGERAMPLVGECRFPGAPRTLDELVETGAMLLGTPDDVGEQAAGLGVDHVVLIACATDHGQVLDMITRFGEHVISGPVTSAA